ncbi:hypothetical protein E4U13_002845 [Claviceps humidiphila]|uniref:Uncharacterized protein n=1 Tax=Claviceps humidiphila TaxID=1294629 RepID=A0A9P7TY53_9HYPO|nr:hypothetical protein E4U13_002845 [Claviceps humidiphila]
MQLESLMKPTSFLFLENPPMTIEERIPDMSPAMQSPSEAASDATNVFPTRFTDEQWDELLTEFSDDECQSKKNRKEEEAPWKQHPSVTECHDAM